MRCLHPFPDDICSREAWTTFVKEDYLFSKETEQLKDWFRLADFPESRFFICSDHFNPKDYFNWVTWRNSQTSIPILKPSRVPSIHVYPSTATNQESTGETRAEYNSAQTDAATGGHPEPSSPEYPYLWEESSCEPSTIPFEPSDFFVENELRIDRAGQGPFDESSAATSGQEEPFGPDPGITGHVTVKKEPTDPSDAIAEEAHLGWSFSSTTDLEDSQGPGTENAGNITVKKEPCESSGGGVQRESFDSSSSSSSDEEDSWEPSSKGAGNVPVKERPCEPSGGGVQRESFDWSSSSSSDEEDDETVQNEKSGPSDVTVKNAQQDVSKHALLIYTSVKWN